MTAKKSYRRERKRAGRAVTRVGLLSITLALLTSLAPSADARFRSGALEQQQHTVVESLAELQARITAHISQPRFAPAAWGIKIVSLDTGKTIFEHNAGKYFSPASNAKLFTAALALDRLGPDARIKTSIYTNGRVTSTGTVKGDLIIYGRGDPTISTRFTNGDYYSALEPLANALSLAGVRRVEGDLVGDESYFQGSPFGWGWEWHNLQWKDGAETSALSLNENIIGLDVKPAERPGVPCRVTTDPPTRFVTLMNRTTTVPKDAKPRIAVYRPVGENVIYVSGQFPVGSAGYSGKITVHNPAGLFVSILKEVLGRRGIAVTGRARVADWKYREVTPLDLTKLRELGSIESMPVKEIVREMMKPSQNLYAQMLLLVVGAGEKSGPEAARSRPQHSTVNTEEFDAIAAGADQAKTTEEKGIFAMNAFLREAGIKKGEVVLEEGAGLSRANMITPSATVELLRYMSRHRYADLYRSSLPVAGVDGTLQNRMKGTDAETNVRAKTGTLRYVSTLSGYVTTAAGERLAFSILLNNYYNADRGHSSRDDIDLIPVLLTSFGSKSKDLSQ
ncbi:MAG TPA: D-alanyl-D-alanine carboxypeptidase/D-alanyl-D-alanine-endopeptidase [Blastocatellia bacterium]|nr:D-alanyl-D-alanine carboxypeptidase/D-alanyl-D-alanine-endopeptidase [Blastocatellia bacterium]